MCRALAHRGDIDEARGLLRLEPSQFLGIHLEAFTDVVAEQGDWDAARATLPMGREEAARGELLALGFFLDRLEGRMRAAEGDHESAISSLTRSAEGFRGLGAPWEEAFSLLTLASCSNGERIEEPLRTAHNVFDRLGSLREKQRCEDLARDLGVVI